MCSSHYSASQAHREQRLCVQILDIVYFEDGHGAYGRSVIHSAAMSGSAAAFETVLSGPLGDMSAPEVGCLFSIALGVAARSVRDVYADGFNPIFGVWPRQRIWLLLSDRRVHFGHV